MIFVLLLHPISDITILDNLFDNTDETPDAESGVTLLIVVLIANIELFGKDIIFNVADSFNTYCWEEPAKSFMSYTNQKQAQFKTLILTK